MNNDSQGVNLGGQNSAISPGIPTNNTGSGANVTPNIVSEPVIPVVPIIDGSNQPVDNNAVGTANISTPNIMTDSSNTVNNSNIGIVDNTNNINNSDNSAVLGVVGATNNNETANSGIIAVNNDSLSTTVPPVTNETINNNGDANGGVSSTLNFELPSNDTQTSVPNTNDLNSGLTGAVNPVGAESNDSSNANGGVLPVSFNSILSEQNASNVNGQVVQPATAESTVSNNNVTQTTDSTASQPSISVSNDVTNVVSFGKYLGYFLLFTIPIAGFIMLIVKALDKKDKNISNFAKAYLVYSVIIGVVLGILVAVGMVAGVAGIATQLNNGDSEVQVTDSYLYE